MSFTPFIVIGIVLLLGAMDRMSWTYHETEIWTDEYISRRWN